jgi:hypothetical protein
VIERGAPCAGIDREVDVNRLHGASDPDADNGTEGASSCCPHITPVTRIAPGIASNMHIGDIVVSSLQ